MDFAQTANLTWFLIALQLTGLVSTWLTRLSEGCCYHGLFQVAFLILLPLIGGTTIFALTFGSISWLASGSTLAVMVVSAVWGSERSRGVPVW